MHYPRFTFRLRTLIVLPAILAAVAFSGCPPSGIQENFVLAYVNRANQIVVRTMEAKTGTTWINGKFPTTMQAGMGVGLAADTAGVVHIIFTNEKTSANMKMVWGIGPAVWDKSAASVFATTPASGVSTVSLGGNRWLVTYQQTGGSVFAGIYDHASRQIIANVSPMGPLVSGVEGRPCVARSHRTVVITWRRWNGQVFDLVAASGNLNDGNIVFNAARVIPTPADRDLAIGVTGDPVVTTNLGAFYILVVREQKSTGGLHGWRAQLIGSQNGADWRLLTATGCLNVRTNTHLAAAGASNGKILAASLSSLPDGAIESAAIYANGDWTPFSDDQVSAMFGGTAAWKQFTLIDNKP